MTQPSTKQEYIRSMFKLSSRCFNIQPTTGGATPPDEGPRNRSWWYTAAGASGLWYYDYFIQQTINKYLSGAIPEWCYLKHTTYPLYSKYSRGYYGGTEGQNYVRNKAWQNCLNGIDYRDDYENRIGVFAMVSATEFSNGGWCWDHRVTFKIPEIHDFPEAGALIKILFWSKPTGAYEPFQISVFSLTPGGGGGDPWYKQQGNFIYSFGSNNIISGSPYDYYLLFIPNSFLYLNNDCSIVLRNANNLTSNPIPHVKYEFPGTSKARLLFINKKANEYADIYLV